MALAASAWVTTEQELKFAVETTAVVVDAAGGVVVEPADAVVAEATDAVVEVTADDLEDELHAASNTTAVLATTIPTTLDRSLIGPHLVGMMCTRWSVWLDADLRSRLTVHF
jgi:hypothetical protein